MRGNTGDFVAIDHFGFAAIEVQGAVNVPPATGRCWRRTCGASARRARRSSRATRSSCSRAARSAIGKVGVYYYDGPHDYASQERGLRSVEPWLADLALLVVDDYDWDAVEHGTAAYLASQPNAESCSSTIAGADNGSPQWWEGVAVLGWRALAGYGARAARAVTPSTRSGRTSASCAAPRRPAASVWRAK